MHDPELIALMEKHDKWLDETAVYERCGCGQAIPESEHTRHVLDIICAAGYRISKLPPAEVEASAAEIAAANLLARYRKHSTIIDAMQWTGADGNADALWEWTGKLNAIGDAWPTMFIVLGEDDAYAALGDLNDDYEVVGTEVSSRIAAGATAVVLTNIGGWKNLSLGDWIAHLGSGCFEVVGPQELAETYERLDVAASAGGAL